MNYRQWKKSYKKKHGYNPGIEEDKRKQAKAIATDFSKMIEGVVNTIHNIYSHTMLYFLKSKE